MARKVLSQAAGRENQPGTARVEAVASAIHRAGAMRPRASQPGHGPMASMGGQGPRVALSVGEELAAVFPDACFVVLHCLAARAAGASALPAAAFRVIFFSSPFFFFHHGDLLIEISFQ